MADLRVLIVEDHDAVRSSLRDWVASELPGAVTCDVPSGEDALEAAAAFAPDVVLMDLGLPGISGIETTRRLTAQPRSPRVVIVSIHETASHRAASAAAGAVAYVPKSSMVDRLGPLLRRLTAEIAAEQRPSRGDVPR